MTEGADEMDRQKPFPVGVDDFSKIVSGYYYVDKTRLIEDLLNMGSEVTLFTRPRRFGKSLNMSMLKAFFEIGADIHLFDGLYISGRSALIDRYFGKYPVVFVSMKKVEGNNFSEAVSRMNTVFSREAERFEFMLKDDRLSIAKKRKLQSLMEHGNEANSNSLYDLTDILSSYYGKKVVVLIDEYDVPLAKAFDRGYYDEMIVLMRDLFGDALKSNTNLEFAVLTGCLRITKESIFTGLNNFKVNSITDFAFGEKFGFTDEEVRELLTCYGMEKHYDDIRQWYDGYRFGNVDVYCPWDVLNYCQDLSINDEQPPRNYWMNTSGNEIVNKFIDEIVVSDLQTKAELVKLVQGQSVKKRVSENLTYRDIGSNLANIWSALFMTGYLTCRSGYYGNEFDLVIPNKEIASIVEDTIIAKFDRANNDGARRLARFCNALQDGEPDVVEAIFNEYLKNSISINDTRVRDGKKENFYQGIFLGLLLYKIEWNPRTNYENGDGFTDLAMNTDNPEVGVIVEFKYSKSDDLLPACKEAMSQISDRDYVDGFFRQHESVKTVYKYGIACHKKECRIVFGMEKR